MKRLLVIAFSIMISSAAMALDSAGYRFHAMPETSYYGGINSIAKDAKGRMWFTGTDVLFMFDGENYHQIRPLENIPDYRTVRCSPTSGLLVTTSKGVLAYDYDRQAFDLVLKGNAGAAEIDALGRAWMAFNDTLAVYLGAGKICFYPSTDSAMRPPFNTHVTESGVYLSSGAILFKLDTDTGRFSQVGTYASNSGADDSSDQIVDVLSADNKLFVLNGKGGLYVCDSDGAIERRWTRKASGSSALFKELYISDGIVWMASQSGMILYDTASGTATELHRNFSNPFSLPNDSVWTIYGDPDGGTWIGTYGGKLGYRNPSDDDIFSVKPAEGGLNHPIVSAFAEDAYGRLWIGTEGGGILCADISGGYLKKVELPYEVKLKSSLIKSLKFIADKLYIASFNGGLSVLDIHTGRCQYICGSSVYDFAIEGTRGIWLTNPDSDLMYWNRSTGRMDAVRGIEMNGTQTRIRAESVYMGEDGNLWLLTHSGLVVLDTDTHKILRSFSIPGSDDLRTFCRASDGSVVIGTRGGGIIVFSSEGEYRRLYDSRGEALTGVRVLAIQEDVDTGNLWIASDDGIYCYNKKDNLFERPVSACDGKCGSYYIRSSFRMSNGVLAFGGTDGFIYFSPSRMGLNRQKPVPFIRYINAGGEDIPAEKMSKAFKVKYGQRDIEIGFSSNSYLENRLNTYAYRLRGSSDDWVVLPKGQSYVSFLKLRSGRYHFEIKAANNNGVWGDAVCGVDFVVKYYPLMSPVAMCVYALLALMLLLFIWSYATKRKMLEQELELEVQKEEHLQELNRARNEFFTNISHDLKTPLSLVIDPLRLLEKQIPQDASYKNLVSLIGRNISRVQRVLTQLLQFRQIETVKLPMNETTGDIVKFVDSIFSLFEFYATRKQIETDFIAWSDNFNAVFDRERVEKIFTNLFSNAIKYTYDGGFVCVRIEPSAAGDIPVDSPAHPEAQWLTFTVSNSGPDIPEDRMASLFDPFSTEGKTRQEFESRTGLGLAIVKAIVLELGGRISVGSSGGTVCFTVVLPFIPSTQIVTDTAEDDVYDYTDAEIDAMISEIRDMKSSSSPSTRKTQDILIIEDDADLRSYMEQRLSSRYNTYTAANGTEGLAKAGKVLPDIIITDLIMPGMNGFELCRAIRSDLKTSHIPIVALSAVGENENSRIEAIEAGANVFLDKPVNMDFLLTQIAGIISEHKKMKEIYSKRYVVEPAAVASTSMDEELMKKALDFIESNIDNEEYGVENFVSDMAIGRTRLYQKISDLTGMSIKEFILDIRLKRASQLLRESEYTVSEIASHTGFSDPKYFSVCFKRHFGHTPTEYKAGGHTE